MTTPLNVALIGYGYAGKTFHAPLIAAIPALRLAAVSSRDAAKVKADWPDVAVYADPLAAIQHDGIDLVVIASPNDSHAPLATAALLADRHVVVDKPFTLTVSEAEQLMALEKRQNRLLSVFHSRRWDSDFLTLKDIIKQGTLGEILTLESRLDRHRPEVKVRWREENVPGGGLWYDLGPHLIDQALQLFGTPQAVTVHLAAQRPGAKIDDWFMAHLNYGRLRVTLSASMLMASPTPRFAVHGTKGSWLKYGVDTQEAALKEGVKPGQGDWGLDSFPGLFYENPESDPVRSPEGRGEYRHYYHQMAQAILKGTPVPVTSADALAVMRIVEQGLRG